jgi:two-component system, OmpR family, heavy metal sensor histidine kinase CusS
MDDKDQALSHPKPLGDGEPDSGDERPRPAEQTFSRQPVRGFGIPVDSKACRECLGAIAHRLAQPITALRGGIELGLMGTRTAAEYRAILEQSMQLADGMVQMIVSLRDLGESVGVGGPKQSVNLKSVIEETLAEMESLALARELRFDFKAGELKDVAVDAVRVREAFHGLMRWIIQNSAGAGTITVKCQLTEGKAQVLLSPPRLDLQYLQIKILDDITTPGVRFSHAAKAGGLGWAIHQQAIEGSGGKVEMLMEGSGARAICVSFALAPPG